MQQTLPKGWKWVRLGEAGKIITGNTPSKQDNDFYDKRYANFFKPDDFNDNDVTILEHSKDFLSEKGFNSARVAPSGSVLVTCIGNIGKVGILKDSSSFNQQINAIAPYRSGLISKFLAYSILNRKKYLERFIHAPVVPIINKSHFSKFEIPLPPLPTQHKIVEILEEADNLRKLRRQADDQMKDLIPSLFVQMLGDPATNPKGWEVSRLRYHAAAVKNGLFKRPQEFGSGVPLINVVDVFSEYKVDLTRLEKVSATQEETEKYAVQDGDLFFCRSSLKKEGIAKCAVALGLKEPSVFECHTIMVRLNKENLNPLFASIYMNHPGVRAYTVNTSQTATMTTVGQKDILKQQIFLPPLPLQQEFAKLVEDIEAEKARQAEGRKKLDELFNSLMQRAFTGELVA